MNKVSWWIPEKDYTELRTYCALYNTWKAVIEDIDTFSGHSSSFVKATPDIDMYTVENRAMIRSAMQGRIDLLDSVAVDTDPVLGKHVLKGITCGIRYEDLNINDICTRTEYYENFRKFLYLLRERRNKITSYNE